MGRLAAHDAAERDHARVAARLCERHRADRQLERAGNRHHRDPLFGHARRSERFESRLEQQVRDLAVEARDHDADRAVRAGRRALEDGDVVRDLELAGNMPRRRDRNLRLFLGFLLRLGLGLGLGDRSLLDLRLCLRLLLPRLRPRGRLRLGGRGLWLLHVFHFFLLGGRVRLARPETPTRAHSPSDSNLRSWWCNLCPSLSRLAAR